MWWRNYNNKIINDCDQQQPELTWYNTVTSDINDGLLLLLCTRYPSAIK